MMRDTLEIRVLDRIARKRRDVFLRDDFTDLGGYDQVGRVLRSLVREGRLVKIGYGLYTRAKASPFDGTPAPVKGIQSLMTEALKRLGIKPVATQFERDYAAGRTTQVPTGRTIGVTRRVRRKIGYNGAIVRFERARPSLD
ncbi:MAG: hypothetical protein ACHQRJ_08330 [Alphaproteobacteria bacterium]